MSLILIYVVVIGAAFMFMTSRGRKKQAAQAQSMQQALVPGAEVRTIGGLVGSVAELTDEYVVIETTPGVKLKFTKQAIAGVVQPADPDAPVYGEELTSQEAEALESEASDEAEAEVETESEPEDAKDQQKVG